MRTNKTYIIGKIFILLLGIALIAGGIISHKIAVYKSENWTHTSAQVVDVDTDYTEDSDGNRETVYYAIVEYSVNGKTYRNKNNEGSGIPPSVGTSREIAYNPDDPQQSIFVSEASPTVMIILCVIGGVLVIASLLLILIVKK